MQLSDEQVARFRRDGFLLFPGLFSKAEIAVLRAETARLASVEADSVIRERTGGVRSIIPILQQSEKPVPTVGPAGTAVLFHCNLLHASGHNLSAEDRWHIYISFNACANAPQFGPNSRPDWVVSRNTGPLPVENDAGVLHAAYTHSFYAR